MLWSILSVGLAILAAGIIVVIVGVNVAFNHGAVTKRAEQNAMYDDRKDDR